MTVKMIFFIKKLFKSLVNSNSRCYNILCKSDNLIDENVAFNENYFLVIAIMRTR